jgi:SNF2 family DNA or RNA helicase
LSKAESFVSRWSSSSFAFKSKKRSVNDIHVLPVFHSFIQVLLFTQSLGALDMVERALTTEVEDIWPKKWKRGREYLRLEGKDSAKDRKEMVDAFNKSSTRPWLFLMSVKVCLIVARIPAHVSRLEA